MIAYQKEMMTQLSKEQLIYLISQLNHSLSLIGEVCVDESKSHLSSAKAVEKIRGCIYHIPTVYGVSELSAFIDMKMGKISVSKYRKILGFDD